MEQRPYDVSIYFGGDRGRFGGGCDGHGGAIQDTMKGTEEDGELEGMLVRVAGIGVMASDSSDSATNANAGQ